MKIFYCNSLVKAPFLFLLITGLFIIFQSGRAGAQSAGDTIRIQFFTFGSSQDSFVVFPPDTVRYEKALMHYKLKCPANGICGPTDKLTYTYLKQHTHTYDTANAEIINRFEIGRFITPYGNNLNLGNGFTWTYDVSDYINLLHDTVYLSAGNGQEALDLSFELIKGIPPRDPVRIENIWNMQLNYDTALPSKLTAKKLLIDPLAQNFRYKMRTTGHGFGGNENCSEFCPKHHYLSVDGVQRWDTLLWKNNCSYNPLYPQGGTWIYNRANWCPGSDVPAYDFELTPFVTPGDSATLHYTIDPYNHTFGGIAYYVIETQLVSYTAPNFTLDAGVWDIKAPSTADVYKRMNPICSQPVITIQNTGSETLTSLTITYGIEGGPESIYNWTGSLPFTQKQDVMLPAFSWSNASNKFKVTVSNPNGGADQYANNNSMESVCAYPPQYVGDLILELLTSNHSDTENSYTLKDANGNIVFQRNNLLNNKLYKDTLHLANGCYEFRLEDDWGETDPGSAAFNQGDGMWNWPDTSITVGHMYIRKALNGQVVKNFTNMDFGHELFQQFTVGYFLSVPDMAYDDAITIYPNPSKGVFNLDMSFAKGQHITAAVFDMMGREVFRADYKNVLIENNQVDLSTQPNGIYFITVQMKDKRMTRRLVKQD